MQYAIRIGAVAGLLAVSVPATQARADAAGGVGPTIDVSEIHEALIRLTALDERQGQAITLRYFGGLTGEEIAGLLNIGVATVTRDLRLAQAWLQRELKGDARTTE